MLLHKKTPAREMLASPASTFLAATFNLRVGNGRGGTTPTAVETPRCPRSPTLKLVKPGSALAKLKALVKERNLLLWGGLATAGGAAAISVLSLVFGRREMARALHLLLGVAALFAVSLGAWFECPTPAACSLVNRRKVDTTLVVANSPGTESLYNTWWVSRVNAASRGFCGREAVSPANQSASKTQLAIFSSRIRHVQYKKGIGQRKTCSGRGFESNLSLFHCRTAYAWPFIGRFLS